MKWLTILILAIAIALTILAALPFASGHAEDETSPIFGVKIPARISRLATDLRGPRRRQPQRFARHSGQRRSDQGLPGRDASVPGRHDHCPARLELRLRWRKATKAFGRLQSFVAGPPTNGVQFMVKDSQKIRLDRRLGVRSIQTTANPPTRRCTKTCFPCHATGQSSRLCLQPLRTFVPRFHCHWGANAVAQPSHREVEKHAHQGKYRAYSCDRSLHHFCGSGGRDQASSHRPCSFADLQHRDLTTFP